MSAASLARKSQAKSTRLAAAPRLPRWTRFSTTHSRGHWRILGRSFDTLAGFECREKCSVFGHLRSNSGILGDFRRAFCFQITAFPAARPYHLNSNDHISDSAPAGRGRFLRRVSGGATQPAGGLLPALRRGPGRAANPPDAARDRLSNLKHLRWGSALPSWTYFQQLTAQTDQVCSHVFSMTYGLLQKTKSVPNRRSFAKKGPFSAILQSTFWRRVGQIRFRPWAPDFSLLPPGPWLLTPPRSSGLLSTTDGMLQKAKSVQNLEFFAKKGPF